MFAVPGGAIHWSLTRGQVSGRVRLSALGSKFRNSAVQVSERQTSHETVSVNKMFLSLC